MKWEKATEIIDSILPGETVLLKYRTSYIPEFVLRFFIDYSQEKGIPLLVDDNFDSLHTLAIHAKTLNLPLDLDSVYVLKTGGKYELGNVMAKVPFHPDPRVYLENYEEASKKTLNELRPPIINLVLGVENIFLVIRNPTDVYRIFLAIQRFVGRKERKAFYVINENVIQSLPFNVVPELERIATTVMEMLPYPTGASVRVLKSINPELIGRELRINVGG
ncbi:DUF257 family protein [Thermococcus thioreducens]|uniref:Uncharacterized protein n=1 Tax=Thermococcus thioreducens TaxID=277988 RepID=A0A0Q2M248_9EURY|nr:DUF257 family protein [Thermococcus thioreducens]ASJ11801.1 hypothetical protein A3L14_02360 [Thermococcus thioreducens]KQH82137.1 hypothetical protein AMR53_07300 [Thermococcus thioreducens]SEW13536.1 protein of unknown function, DUF257 [Thermococcus thioreducens]